MLKYEVFPLRFCIKKENRGKNNSFNKKPRAFLVKDEE
jgi:hypothetical protein